MKRVFSGIKATGHLHLGNYLGALSQWVKHQDTYQNFFCIVDLHSITVPIDPKQLAEFRKITAAWYIAAGIDPQKSVMFFQSQNHDHAQLQWILNCFTSMGQLNRMTQYKDKKEKVDFISVGLFDYPVLMAADILLYDTDLVPVGEDQKQHIELTRDLAERFNHTFGQTFVLPEYMPPLIGARIMSLQDPARKMSKSEDDPSGTIDLRDTPDKIRKKIGSAVTDAGNEVKPGPDKPGITNLIAIHSAITNATVEELDQEYSGKGYKVFKDAVTEVVIEHLAPLQKRYNEIYNSPELDQILTQGAQKASETSHIKLATVMEKVGLQ